MEVPWPDESIFEPYIIFEEIFKTVKNHDIKAAILMPKDLKPGPHPVMIHTHGGFLVTAHSLFPGFFPRWADKLARENNAIIVAPDYRLLPSVNGVADVLEDLEDFWAWSKSELPRILEQKVPSHTLDFSQLLLCGGSAGGYCAVQLALSHPDDVSVLAINYPLLDLKDSLYLHGPTHDEPNVLRTPSKDIPSKEETVVWIKETRQVIATKAGFERTPFCVGMVHHGLFSSEVLDNRGLDLPAFSPLQRVSNGEKLPARLWLMHGDDDSAVPIRGSHDFIEIVQKNLPGTKLRFDIRPGQDHGFDFDESSWASITPEAMEFLKDGWLQ